MLLISSFKAMCPILLLSVVGWAITRAGWVTPAVEAFIPKLLVRVVIPPYLTACITVNVTAADLPGLALGTLVPSAGIAACYVLARALAPLLGVDRRRRTIFSVSVAFSNTILIGLPVNMALFGEVAMPACLVYFFAHSFLFWSFGAWLMALEGGRGRPTPRQAAGQLFCPPMLGILAGLALVLAGAALPKPALDACLSLGGASTPLALLYTGVIIARTEWDRVPRMARDLALCLAGRVALCPLVFAAMMPFLDLPRLTEQVYVIQSGLPVIMTVSFYAAYVGADREFGSLMVALSSIAGILIVPVWMAAASLLP